MHTRWWMGFGVVALGLVAVVAALRPSAPPGPIDCSDPPPWPAAEGPRHPDAWLGDQRALVLLLAWEDAPPSVSREEVEEDFFGAEHSLAAWFREASSERFTLSGTVLDWRTVTARWADQHPKDPGNAGKLALCAFADAIDVAAHDAQGNGRIDHLFVVHSGRLPVDRIGPRALFVPGRVADRSVLLPARGVGSVGEDLPIGWYTHEAMHRYHGFRDRYGDHRHGTYGIGVWGLMGLGQWGPRADIPRAEVNRYPVHPRARAKMRMGWVDARYVEVDESDVLLEPVEAGGGVLRVAGADGYDLVLEVRSPVGFHAALPGHGLLVWREPHDLNGEVTLIQADGRDDLAHGNDLGVRPVPPIDENFGDASDPFPGSLGVTEMVDPVTGVALRNIRQEGAAVRFDIDRP